MKKQTLRNILLVVGLIILGWVVYMVYFFFQDKHVDWRETYRFESKEPYNTFVFVKLLENYFTEDKFLITDGLLTETFEEEQDTTKHTTYVFVGEDICLNTKEVEALLNFVEKGNTAFLANTNSYSESTDSLFYRLFDAYGIINHFFIEDSVLRTNFVSPNLSTPEDFSFVYKPNKVPTTRNWNVFDPELLKDLKKKEDIQLDVLDLIRAKDDKVISFQEDGSAIVKSWIISEENFTDFVRIKYGKGYFYFHRNPILFTNYYLIREEGKAYLERVLSYFPEGDIIWDEGSHHCKEENDTPQKVNYPDPLNYILAQPPLAWAYYTLLVSVILFIIFRGKRLQRAIPILHKEANTSLEFVQTIGHLYFAQKNHARLAQLKKRLFFDFVRTHYHLPTHTIDEEFRTKLIQRSGLDEEFIDNLLDDLSHIQQNQTTSEWFLRKLHTQIHDFYTHCK